jgi:2-hydroxy-3-keto-5-methylthiopentenyl-1-phosphate phosphatase
VTRAELVPAFESTGAPVSVLIDYDGTISLEDVGDSLMVRYARVEPELLAEMDRRYYQGTIGSRELMTWDVEMLPPDEGFLRQAAMAVPQDEALVDLVGVARRHGAAVEVVSDGFGFHVEPKLAELGLADLPVATNETVLGESERSIRFPYGHPRCFVCGTCKRERVRLHQQARRAVVFIGDGTSDRFAAAHADSVFAKGSLARICRQEGWPYRDWDRLADVADWLEPAFADGSLPTSAADFDRWRADHAPAPRAFICGPEVWGEGRTVPGPGPR